MIEIEAVSDALGAMVRGADFSRPDGAQADALRDAWHRHHVLLFRDQELTPETLLTAVRIFGVPQVGARTRYYQAARQQDPAAVPGHPELTVLSNLDADGNPCERNESLGSGEVVWHSDNSYIADPPAGSVLYSREIPPDGSGNTWFSNQVLALAELPPKLLQAIAGRRAKHDASRNSAGELRPGIAAPQTPAEVPGPMHPMVRRHPDSGLEALYLGRRRTWPSQFIEGYDDATSESLLDALWAHATDPRYCWEHRWRPGDLLVWDNRTTMHYREPVNPRERRVMWRSQFQGEAVLAA